MEMTVGVGLLGEVEERSLEEILEDFRTGLNPSAKASITKSTNIPELDGIVARHFHTTREATLSLTGRALPLLYHLISYLLSPPHSYAVLLIDLEYHFDPTRLSCSTDLLSHLHIIRPPAADDASNTSFLRNLVSEAFEELIYRHLSDNTLPSSRPFWGTIVIGAIGAGDIGASWKGWLRVDREDTSGFPLNTSARECLDRRNERQELVQQSGWVARSVWGEYFF